MKMLLPLIQQVTSICFNEGLFKGMLFVNY